MPNLSYERCNAFNCFCAKISVLLPAKWSKLALSLSVDCLFTFVRSLAVIFLQYATKVATLRTYNFVTYLPTYITLNCCLLLC